MKSFENLLAWQKAHNFVLCVYKKCKSFPSFEKFGLTSQLQRAAVSIPSNLAEGYSRNGIQDKIRFFNIAESSLAECKYQLILAKDLGYIENIDELISQANNTKYFIHKYILSLKQNI